MKPRQTVLPETPVEEYFWPGSGGWRRAELGTDPAERVSPAGVSGAGEGPGWAQTPSRGLHYTSCDAGKTASQTGSCGEERLRQAKKRRPDPTEPEVAKSNPKAHRKERVPTSSPRRPPRPAPLAAEPRRAAPARGTGACGTGAGGGGSFGSSGGAEGPALTSGATGHRGLLHLSVIHKIDSKGHNPLSAQMASAKILREILTHTQPAFHKSRRCS